MHHAPTNGQAAAPPTGQDHRLPDQAPIDFDTIDASVDGIPFATGPDGGVVEFHSADSPHAYISGLSGSGKSDFARTVLYGALVTGWDCYVIEPQKGGVDFAFAADRCRGVATTVAGAVEVMRHVHTEVTSRTELLAHADVTEISELSDPPPPILLLVDEDPILVDAVQRPSGVDAAGRAAAQEFFTLAGQVLETGPAAGVAMVFVTQDPIRPKQIPEIATALGAMTAHLLLGRSSQGQRALALRAFANAPALDATAPAGRGVWEPLGRRPAVIQVWSSPTAVLARELEARVPAIPSQDRLELAGQEDMPDLSDLDLPPGAGPHDA